MTKGKLYLDPARRISEVSWFLNEGDAIIFDQEQGSYHPIIFRITKTGYYRVTAYVNFIEMKNEETGEPVLPEQHIDYGSEIYINATLDPSQVVENTQTDGSQVRSVYDQTYVTDYTDQLSQMMVSNVNMGNRVVTFNNTVGRYVVRDSVMTDLDVNTSITIPNTHTEWF